MSYSYNRLIIQDKIRKQSIYESIKVVNSRFFISNFYWPHSFKNGDYIDKFSSESALGKMYNVDSIDEFETYFDYSILLDGKYINTNIRINNDLVITGVIIVNDGLLRGSSIALNLDKTRLDSTKLSVKIIGKNGNEINNNGNSNGVYSINKILDKYVIIFTVDVRKNSVEKIVFNRNEIKI